MVKSQTVDIDGIEVTTTQFTFMRSSALMAKLGKVIAPAIGMLNSFDLESDISTLGPAIGALCSQLPSHEVEPLFLEILAGTNVTIGNKMFTLDSKAKIDTAFSGQMLTGFKVIAHALKVNYAESFGVALGSNDAPMTPAANL